MVSNEVWMDSGAMVSMIPEQDIFLGTFASNPPAAANGQRTFTLNSTFTTNFLLLPNLYRGCEVEFHSSSASSGSLSTAVVASDVTGAGLLANQAVQSQAQIVAGSSVTQGSNTELVLTLRKHITAFTFATESGANYEDNDAGHHGFITIYIAGVDGTERLAIIFDDGSTSAISTSADRDITIATANLTGKTGAEIAELVANALANEDVTTSRNGVVLTITNTVGGFVADSAEDTQAGVTVENTGGGIIDAVTITNAGTGLNSVSGVDFTITSAAGTNPVIHITTGSNNVFKDRAIINSNAANTITVADTIHGDIISSATNYYAVIKHSGAPVPAPKVGSNPALLSDTWIGLTDTVQVPSTSIEMKQIALNSGSRNMAYQFKGAETTSGGSFSVSANNFSWLYYALGSKTIEGANGQAGITVSNNFATSGLSSNSTNNSDSFIYDADVPSAGFHRVAKNIICPPLNSALGQNTGTVKKISDTLTNKITYSFTENNSADLPSFALEYTLKKPASMATEEVDITSTTVNTIVRDISETVYSKIYPGCQVESLNLTAAAGQEMKMTVNFNSKNTFTAPNNYVTANNTTDLQKWINFGSPQGSQAKINEEQLRPFFFSDGTIEMFGQEYIRIESMSLDISNGLMPKRFIGRYDKNSQSHIPGQRTYTLNFTGLVTDNLLFEELRNNAATSLSGTDDNEIKLTFTKDLVTDESLTMVFKDYMVTVADFPLTNDKGPITVSWTIQPLLLKSCTHITNWVIQG